MVLHLRIQMEHNKNKADDTDDNRIRESIDKGTLPVEKYLEWKDKKFQRNVLHWAAHSCTEAALKLVQDLPVDVSYYLLKSPLIMTRL